MVEEKIEEENEKIRKKTGEFLQRRNLKRGVMLRSLIVDLTFIFHFSLYFIFSFSFLFLEQLGLGFSSHAVTSVTI